MNLIMPIGAQQERHNLRHTEETDNFHVELLEVTADDVHVRLSLNLDFLMD